MHAFTHSYWSEWIHITRYTNVNLWTTLGSVLFNDALNCCDYIAPVTDGAMGEWYWRRKTEVPREKPVYCHSVHHKSHIDWPGTKQLTKVHVTQEVCEVSDPHNCVCWRFRSSLMLLCVKSRGYYINSVQSVKCKWFFKEKFNLFNNILFT